MTALRALPACAALIGALAASSVAADGVPRHVLAKDLLLPCQEADNDPRDGFLAELECITFIEGFVTATALAEDATAPWCLPVQNASDAMRRSFVAWVHASFSARSKMPVGEALRTALSEGFPCS